MHCCDTIHHLLAASLDCTESLNIAPAPAPPTRPPCTLPQALRWPSGSHGHAATLWRAPWPRRPASLPGRAPGTDALPTRPWHAAPDGRCVAACLLLLASCNTEHAWQPAEVFWPAAACWLTHKGCVLLEVIYLISHFTSCLRSVQASSACWQYDVFSPSPPFLCYAHVLFALAGMPQPGPGSGPGGPLFPISGGGGGGGGTNRPSGTEGQLFPIGKN